MLKIPQAIRPFLLRSLLTFAGCLIIGVVFFQTDVFDPIAVPFQFISYGILGSVFFAALRSVPLRTSVVIFVLTCVILIAVFTWPLEFPYILSDTLMLAGIGVALYIIHRSAFDRMQNVRWARPLVFSSLVAIAEVGAALLMMFYHRDFVLFSQPPYETISLGFLVGLGLGIGFEISEWTTARAGRASGGSA